MPSPFVTELALRAAANTGSRDLTSAGGGHADAMKDTALKRAQDQITANSDVSTASGQMSAQNDAIGIAIAVAALAYVEVSKQLDILANRRLAFDTEREVGFATFTLPTNKVAADLSKEEKIIKRVTKEVILEKI